MKRMGATALVLSMFTVAGATFISTGASAASISVKVSPASNLVSGKSITISGRGLVKSYRGAVQTWFATECTAAVQRRLDPATDTPHCDITRAISIKVARNGTFTAHLQVLSGIVGDGYCGTAGHLTCVIGVGTAQGLGTVVHISFKGTGSGTTTTTH